MVIRDEDLGGSSIQHVGRGPAAAESRITGLGRGVWLLAAIPWIPARGSAPNLKPVSSRVLAILMQHPFMQLACPLIGETKRSDLLLSSDKG